jgi:hypothetical protein
LLPPGRAPGWRAFFLALAALIAMQTTGAHAESAAEKGLAIVREAERRSQGWVDSVADARMILRDRQGNASVRRMELRSLEAGPGTDGGRTLLFFRSPPDVDGTALLTHSHATRDDDQWLYLPEIKRVKRISGSGKSGSFMGSEFSYEDLASQEVDKFKHKLLGEEDLGGRKTWKIERTPVDPRSGYSKQTLWIDQQYMQGVKIDFYDRKGELLKTLTLEGMKPYGKWFRADKLVMVNRQTKKESHLTFANRKLGTELKAKDFESDGLGE